MNRTAHAEQVAIEVHREACNRIQQLTEVVEKLQQAGMTLELSERESHAQAIIAYEAECNALAQKNGACNATIQRLETHCSNLETSLTAYRATAENRSPTSLPPVLNRSDPVHQQPGPSSPLAPILDAIQSFLVGSMLLRQAVRVSSISRPPTLTRRKRRLVADKRREEKELADGRAMHQARIEL